VSKNNLDIIGAFWKIDKKMLVLGTENFNLWMYSFTGNPTEGYVA